MKTEKRKTRSRRNPAKRRDAPAARVARAAAWLVGGLVFVRFLRRLRIERPAPPTGGMAIGPDPSALPAGRIFGEGKRDVVEQASWESFPASDPPAY